MQGGNVRAEAGKLDTLETVYTKTGAIYPLEELYDFSDVAQ